MKKFSSKINPKNKSRVTKTQLVICFSILMVITIIGVSFASYTTESETHAIVNSKVGEFSLGDITMKLLVDGSPMTITEFNATKYEGPTITCRKGSTVTFNYEYQRFETSSVVPKDKCTAVFTTPSSKTTLNTYITSLAESNPTQGDGQVISENGIRYQGKNPNNYIWFNNELWRIIGVFDSDRHGITGENLVKIIRVSSLGGLAFNSANTNDWNNSSLKKLLNGAYYDWDTNSSSASTYCYGYSTIASQNCNYSNKGINDEYRGMIKNVTWYLGGYSSATNASSFYDYERSGAYVYSGRETSGTGYIGLMYASDYGYSALSSDCAKTTLLSAYNSASCGGKNWLYGNSYERIITPYSGNATDVYTITSHGSVINFNANVGFVIRPVLYLDSSVYVKNATTEDLGSKTNPYLIGM